MATLPTYKFEIERPIEAVPEIVRPEIDLEAQAEQQRILEEEQKASTMLMVTLIVVKFNRPFIRLAGNRIFSEETAEI